MSEFPSDIFQLFKVENFVACIYHSLIIHSSVNGLLCCFHVLSVVNIAAVKSSVHLSLADPDFNSFWYIHRRVMTGSYCNFIFKFLKNCHTVLHNCYTISCSHQQCTRVPVSPYCLQCLLWLFFFFNSSHLNECEVVSHSLDLNFSND